MWRISPVAGLLVALSAIASAAHDHGGPALGGSAPQEPGMQSLRQEKARSYFTDLPVVAQDGKERRFFRSEEHTSELQSLRHLVCRLLLEKKKKKKTTVI